MKVLLILLQLEEWSSRKFYATDATKQLFNTQQNITRVHVSQLTVEQFIERFEKPNLPVLLQGTSVSMQVAPKTGKLTSIGHSNTSTNTTKMSSLRLPKMMKDKNFEFP